MFLGICTLKILELINFKCLFKEVFNIYCAGCGTTRMLESILDLEFYKAFRYNPFMFILFIIIFIYIIYLSLIYILYDKIIFPKNKYFVVVIICMILYMILRKISIFKFLRP